MRTKDNYVGLTADLDEGLGITPIAKIILDARLFGFIDDDEDCKDWSLKRIQVLYDRGAQAWQPYGNLPTGLPEDLAKRHAELYATATRQTRKAGWDPMKDLQDETT